MDVALSFYKPEHADGLNGFVLSEEDKKFTALPIDVLPQALIMPGSLPDSHFKRRPPRRFFYFTYLKRNHCSVFEQCVCHFAECAVITCAASGKRLCQTSDAAAPRFCCKLLSLV